MRIVFCLIILYLSACGTPTRETPEQQTEKIYFGTYNSKDFFDDICPLSLQNIDATPLLRLYNDSTHLVRVDVGSLSNLNLTMGSSNPNVTVFKEDKNNFKLDVSRVVKESDGYDVKLYLLNPYDEGNYRIIRKDTISNTLEFREFEPFVNVDTVAGYRLKIVKKP